MAETLKQRVEGNLKKVDVGTFMAPSGSTGSATPDYVGESVDAFDWLRDGISGLGNSFNSFVDVAANSKVQKAKEEQTKLESAMYDEVYNIKRTPTDMMSASQKEIAIDNIVNKYSSSIPFEKRQAILTANGAETEKTYTYMSEQKGKEQLVEMQASQNTEMAKLAVDMDPSLASVSPAAQIQEGKRIARTSALMTSAFDSIISLGNASDEQTIMARDGRVDEVAEYAKQLFPREARVALYKGDWTPNDTFAFQNSLAMSLSQRINPVTGTKLSKQEADFYAKTVTDRLLAKADKERQESLKRTVEFQEATIQSMQYSIAMSGTLEDQITYVFTGKSPDVLAQTMGSPERVAELASRLKETGVTSNGRLSIPGTVPNYAVSLLADNDNMPLQQADATEALFRRHSEQQTSIGGNKNMLDLIGSRKENWLQTLPQEYAQSNIDTMKQTLPRDISFAFQSLVQANLEPQENEGWLMRAFRTVNNTFVGTGTTRDITNQTQVSGANAQAINGMLTEYSNSLRRIGMPEKDIQDIISSSLDMAGVPQIKKGSVNNIINSVTNMIVEGSLFKDGGVLDKVPDVVKERGVQIALSSAVENINKEEQQTTTSPEAQQQTKELFSGNKQMSSIYEAPEYRSVVKHLTSQVKQEKMTQPQAENELKVFVDKAKNAVASVAKELFGIKTANADTIDTTKYDELNTPDGYDNSGDKSMDKVDILIDEYTKASTTEGVGRFKKTLAVLNRADKILTSDELYEFYRAIAPERNTEAENMAMNQDDRQPSDQLADIQ